MKKLISNFGSSLLSREQLKKIHGGKYGGGDSNVCSACGEDSCNGGCTTQNGNEGSCGWTTSPTGHCTCASAGL